VLANCLIGPDGAKAIAKALLHDASLPKAQLRHLNLYNCAIGPAGGRAMGEMLRSNSTLRGLDLGWNALEDEGAIAVVRALQRNNSTLKELSLARNGLRVDAAREIGTMMSTNSCLEVLSLADNDMGPAAGKLVAAALKRNRSLQQFSCPGNSLGDAGKDFVSTMRDSKSLWKVELHNNGLPESVARELAVLSLQALLRGDPRFDSEEDAAFGEVELEVDAPHPGDDSAHESDTSGSEDGESSDSDAGEPTPGDA
jgi:Ran GTPase-activating protein (RanGAP) involved in mRNA processing and transport